MPCAGTLGAGLIALWVRHEDSSCFRFFSAGEPLKDVLLMLPYVIEVTFCPVLGLKGRGLKLCAPGLMFPIVSVFLFAGEPLEDVMPITVYLREVTDVLPCAGAAGAGLIALSWARTSRLQLFLFLCFCSFFIVCE